MATAPKPKLRRPDKLEATVTSKGQVTLPVALRRQLGLKAGDRLRFEPGEGGFRLVTARDEQESPFERWRGIGIDGIGPGLDAVLAYCREMRGHDEYDDNLT